MGPSSNKTSVLIRTEEAQRAEGYVMVGTETGVMCQQRKASSRQKLGETRKDPPLEPPAGAWPC